MNAERSRRRSRRSLRQAATRPGHHRAQAFWRVLAAVALLVTALGAGAAPAAAESGTDLPMFPPLSPLPPIDASVGWEKHEMSPGGGADLPAQPDEQADTADYHTVFWPDERVRVSPTTSFPASAVTLVLAKTIYGDYVQCTGAFIGPDVVLTAAHCLYHPDYAGWVDNVVVVPGADESATPFGGASASVTYVPVAWGDYGDAASDIGVIVLDNPTLGYATGWFRFGVLGTDSLLDPAFSPSTAGYPADKPFATQWYAEKPAFLAVDDYFLGVDIDMASGQSGSPVWRGRDGLIVGVVDAESPSLNRAVRITATTLSFLTNACNDAGCGLSFYVEPASYEPIVRTWARTDGPVADLRVSRTWMWGPGTFTGPLVETYSEAPGGARTVVYYDKTRMEITNPYADPYSLWYVTNGLLATELITGRLQLGDNSFITLDPAPLNIAGDPNDPFAPTYASFTPLLSYGPMPTGWLVTQTVDRTSRVGDDPALGGYGVTAAVFVPETNHTVASVFWDFMNSEGIVYAGGTETTARLFENPFYATGYPLTEPYWTTVSVSGVPRRVLVQVFQRRVLTYTPDNPDGWKVEAGNVGQHYFAWRYLR